MILTIIIFSVVFVIFTGIQVKIDRNSNSNLGKCILDVNRNVKKSELTLYFFRFIISLVIAIYFIVRDGDVFRINILLFAILMGALSSKVFYPLITLVIFHDSCGVYENGVVTLRGTKLFSDIKYYSFSSKDSEYMFAFMPKNSYLSRPGYFYVGQKDFNKMQKILSRKCCFK